MDFCKKVKITLIFLFGLFLFSFNYVYAEDYNITDKYAYNGKNTYLFVDDSILEYIRNTDEYKELGTSYYMVGILNRNINAYEFYFTPYSFGTPTQFYLPSGQLILSGNFSYIKYSVSTINYNPDTSVWTRSTGTNSGNTRTYTYIRNDNNNYYVYYWGSNNATWFSNWDGFLTDIPNPPPFTAPDINNWTTNDSTTPMIFTSVDDTAFIVVHRNSISLDSTMILNCYDVTNGTNLVQEFELNENSPFLSSDKTQYTIGLYVSNWFHTVTGNKYLFTLTYLDSSNNSNTLSYWFNLSYDTATQENINNNEQQSINNELNKTNEYLTNSNVDYNNVMNQFQDFEVRFSNPNDNYADNLFEILNQMFVSDTVHDFVFTFPFSNGENSITVPANYIETHIPEILLVMIRIFYWYVISRYIIKDIWHVIDKLRQGDYFLTNDKDIKTEIL